MSPAGPPAASALPSGTVAPAQLSSFAPRLRARLCWGIPAVLAGYALFDRSFAYVHVPGLPVFAGELVLAGFLAVAVFATPLVRTAIARSFPLQVLVVFCAWGLVRTVPFVTVFGVDALRDAASWYYALIAPVVAALMLADPRIPQRWARSYERFIPWLLLWSPFALLLPRLSERRWPRVPSTDISIISHKPGNIAVHAALAVAFLFILPDAGGRHRKLLMVLATVVILAVGTQNRGGLIAAVVALVLLAMFERRWLRTAAPVVAAVIVLGAAAWAAGLSISSTKGRTVSVEQLTSNFQSITGQEDERLSRTVDWRRELWQDALESTSRNGKILTGWGFGPNLARHFGFAEGDNVNLRSPHNSHLGVLARMGLVGIALWSVVWLSWFVSCMRAYARMRSSLLSTWHPRLLVAVLVGASAILVNCFFDPTLESPQVAIWLWTLFGLGAYLSASPHTGVP